MSSPTRPGFLQLAVGRQQTRCAQSLARAKCGIEGICDRQEDNRFPGGDERAMEATRVDERDSGWEDDRPRFRVYLHGSAETSTGGWTDT